MNFKDNSSRSTTYIHRSELKGCFLVSGTIELLNMGWDVLNYYMLESEKSFFTYSADGEGGPGYEMFHISDVTSDTDKFNYIKNNYQANVIRGGFSATGLCGNPTGNAFYPLTHSYWYTRTFRERLKGYIFTGMKTYSTAEDADTCVHVACFKYNSTTVTKGAYMAWYSDYAKVDPYGDYNDTYTTEVDANTGLTYNTFSVALPTGITSLSRIDYKPYTVHNPRIVPYAM